MSKLSSSRMILNALARYVPISVFEGIPSDRDTRCTACGVDIHAGDPVVELSPGKGFTDWQYLIAEGSHLCPHCATCFGGTFFSDVQSPLIPAAVFNEDDVWVMLTDAQRHAFLLDPPKPPFVAYVTYPNNNQHIAWRAPVTLDTRVIKLAFGRDLWVIYRDRLMRASERCFELAEHIRANGIKLVPNHPFISLSRELGNDGYGRIRPDIRKWMEAQGLNKDIVFLESLTEGELWGLGVMNKEKPDAPQKVSLGVYIEEKKKKKKKKKS